MRPTPFRAQTSFLSPQVEVFGLSGKYSETLDLFSFGPKIIEK